MTADYLGPLVLEDEIPSELRRRTAKDIYQTVRGATKALIAEKVSLEETEGWRIARRNPKSVRMARPKPADEVLEDEVWCILARMGFKEMSKGRSFTVAVQKGLPRRQIDVFAKDDESLLIVECTHRTSPGPKRMTGLIEKLTAIRPELYKSIRKVYGRHSRLKLQCVIATRNVSWSSADLERCKKSQIAVLGDTELTYYAALVRHLKRAARYQFLAHIFEGRKVDGLATEVVATRGKMGGETFYTFLIRPDDLLKIAYIGHKGSLDIESLETYQRMLQPRRLKQIASFIESGGKFPTNIVLNLKTGRRSGRKKALRFDVKETYGHQSLGVLHLPPNYAAAWVIDGQHRLYGYAYANQLNAFHEDSTLLPVLAYENLPSDKEMNLFIDINSKQVKVSKALLAELYSDLHWNSTDTDEAFRALLARTASRLNSVSNSPLHERVIVAGKRKTHYRCLTQTSLLEGLRVSKLLGGYSRRRGLVPGPLSADRPDDYDANLRKALSVLSDCLRMFSAGLPEHWNLGDARGGYLCTNNGVRAIFHVLADIAEHLRRSDHTELNLFTADETFTELRPYLEALVDYFNAASAQEIQAFRRVPSSLTGVRNQAYGLGAQIRERMPRFNPPGLREYLESRDEAGTEEARGKVVKIELKLFEYVVARLKEHHGTSGEKWWTEGIPVEIRKECAGRWEEKNRQGGPEEQLFLIDYIKICHKNWQLFQDVIALGEKDKGNKRVCTKWIKELNDIRQITFHPARGVLSTDQVAFVRELLQAVERHFP